MRTLVVDPAGESRDALRRAFAAAGEQVRGVESIPEARRLLPEFLPDTVVVALDAPGGDPSAFLEEEARGEASRAVFALVGSGALEQGVEAMARGAEDFLWRPVSDSRVAVVLARLGERREKAAKAEHLRVRLVRAEIASSLTGQSARWRETFAAIERAAASEQPVLLAGEIGTEQEEAARAVHGLSSRGAGAFWKAGLEQPVVARPTGRGTLFIPSLERRPVANQEELLRLVDRPAGFRAVFAVNESPDEALASGKLHPALFETLRGQIVHLPPLRERGEDVDLLARRFLAERDASLAFDPEALDALRAHDWPGNILELKEVVRGAADLSDGVLIGPTLVLSQLAGPRARRRTRRKKPPVVKIAVGASLADVERRLIQKTLEFARGSKPKTAELLKLSLKTIYNKIKEYGLEH